MKHIKCISLMIIIFFIIGCSGNSVKFKTQPESVSNVTKKELIDNWSDYNIWITDSAVVFDPKNDDKKIIVDGMFVGWTKVIDQEMWTEIVKKNTTSDDDFSPQPGIDDYGSYGLSYGATRVREIWGPENQFYGYIIHQQGDGVNSTLDDKSTLRLWYRRFGFGGRVY